MLFHKRSIGKPLIRMPIGDMFSRIRNGQMRSLSSIHIPSSKFRKNILTILKNEGYDVTLEELLNINYNEEFDMFLYQDIGY